MDLSDADRCDPIGPGHCLYPWPNDYFTRADETSETGRRLDLDLFSMPRNTENVPINPADYNRSDGFSPGQMIVAKVPGLDSQEAFEQTGAVPITDMRRAFDPDQPVVVIDAESGERHLIWAEVDAHPEDPEDVTLIIRPGVNLEHGRRYVVALRNMRDADGGLLEAPRGFELFRDEIPTTEPAIEGRRARMEANIFAPLTAAGIDRQDLYLAWDFTVASTTGTTGRMLHMRDVSFAELGDTDLANQTVEGDSPAFAVEEVEEFEPGESGELLRRVRGRFPVPCWLDGVGCQPGSRFAFNPLDEAGEEPLRIPGNVALANFDCIIPRQAEDLEAEDEGLRPSLYGHGLFGSAGEVGAGNVRAMAQEQGFVFCATDWAGMSTLDLPNAVTILQDLSRFPTLVDRVQQGMLHFLFLGRLMLHPAGLGSDPALQVNGRSVFDTERLFYDGNSQGGIIGGALTAVAPDFDRAVLGVPGMNYSTLLRRSVDFDMYAEGTVEGFDTGLGLYDSYPDELERPLILSMVQILWDRGEANGYAHHMTSDPLPGTQPHEVMLHVAFGDHQVADVSAEVEARTIGARAYTPVLDEGRHTNVEPLVFIPRVSSYPAQGSAIVYWDSGQPPSPPFNVPPRDGTDPHGHPRNDIKARIQKSEFLRVNGAIVEACGGIPCYAAGYPGNGQPPVP